MPQPDKQNSDFAKNRKIYVWGYTVAGWSKVPVPLTVPQVSAVPFSASAASAARYGTGLALVL